jgi:hypothetical protein
MGRKKGIQPGAKSKIIYPRECDHCNYIANNPQMWHYHNTTHKKIPTNQLCELGCGQLAIIISTGGKYRCNKNFAKCPKYILEHSERVKKQWERPEAIERKEKTKERFLKCCAGNPTVVEKLKKTLREKFGWNSGEVGKDFRRYARQCRSIAQIWAKEQGYKIGQHTYHVDHKVSIWQAFQSKLPLNIVNHTENLEILSEYNNSSKGWKCSITIEELLKRIGIIDFTPYDTTMKQKRTKCSEAHRKNASIAAKNREHAICIYCNYTSTINVIKSFHNERCKLNPNYVKKKSTEKQKARYSIPMSEETKKKISNAKTGEKHPNFGKTYEELYGAEKALLLKQVKSAKMKKIRKEKKW